MGSSAKRTIDHDEIRRWVEEHGGRPAHVKRTGGGDDPGILRIDFPGFSGEGTLEELDWDTWLQAFDENELAFLYQEDGDSRFNKLVRRTAEDGKPRPQGSQRSASSGRRSVAQPAAKRSSSSGE